MNKKQYILLAILIGLLAAVFSITTTITFVADPQEKNVTPIKEEVSQETFDDLDVYIENLIRYECPGCPDNFRIVDSNGHYSYSCLQFQEKTFVWKAKEYGILPEAEEQEIINLIYDCETQKRVARAMFENEPDAWKHWYTSTITKGLGLPPVM